MPNEEPEPLLPSSETEAFLPKIKETLQVLLKNHGQIIDDIEKSQFEEGKKVENVQQLEKPQITAVHVILVSSLIISLPALAHS